MIRGLYIPLLGTLTLHLLLLLILFVGMPKPSKPIIKPPTPQYVKAKVMTIDEVKALQPKPKVQTPPKPKPVSKPKPKPEPKPKPKKTPPPKPKVDKQAEAKRKAAEAKRVAEKKAAEAKKKQEQEKRRREEEVRKLKEAMERERQEQMQRELAAAMAQEEQAIQAQADSELASSYIALIADVIASNWNRPPSARNNMEVELAIQLIPTGEVTSVSVVRGSGNPAFDRSAENAVNKAGRFEELQQLPPRVFEQYFRRLIFKFRPEDLRL